MILFAKKPKVIYPHALLMALSTDQKTWNAAFSFDVGYVEVEISCIQYNELQRALMRDETYYDVEISGKKVTITSA